MKLEVELDDKGEFVGTVPTELDAVLQRLKAASHGEGYGKGAQKTAEEAKQQIADAIKAEKVKLEAQLPAERQKWAEIEEHNKLLKTRLDSEASEARKQLMAREEAHALEVTKRVEALNKRSERIKTLVNANLKALAAQNGARDESLSELEVILQHRIGYDDDMEPFVKAEDGTPAKTTAGNPIGIDTFVKQYLENHPHHRKPAPGRGGDARRGASLSGGSMTTTVDAARARIENGDRSPSAINELFNAGRKQPSA
jgi:hypothetical protein